jgi:hypothetical protein
MKTRIVELQVKDSFLELKRDIHDLKSKVVDIGLFLRKQYRSQEILGASRICGVDLVELKFLFLLTFFI